MARPADRNELDRQVALHLPCALRIAQRMTGDRHGAEEAVQDSLLKVMRHWRSFRGEASFKTWWMRIVVNVCRDRFRRRLPDVCLETETPDPAAGPDDHVAANETAARVRAEIDRLPPRQREVAILCIAEGVAAAEAAAILDTTPHNIRATLHLIRNRLTAALSDLIPTDQSKTSAPGK
ncbi:ECF RNA polymerase sigma factor SigE [Pirellulimonas nuda]|uniref:ECF RNA polymerase sigma factor SigE n=1 Tax=Pirellulimonas nuda TaxID=2528009 RepID=A0A518DCH8_9BACT|nr:sigma-70 family RNA polymerase sigma factor [Pirellulimonas nuda]QDU89184.1 ECF RNA polymerase sigma factor SigE [Pirellulimonas nuda]